MHVGASRHRQHKALTLLPPSLSPSLSPSLRQSASDEVEMPEGVCIVLCFTVVVLISGGQVIRICHWCHVLLDVDEPCQHLPEGGGTGEGGTSEVKGGGST